MLYGIPFLQTKLTQKRIRGLIRYGYYDMKNVTFDFGISTPPDLRYWNSVVGWCAKSVDMLANRLIFHTFRNDLYGLDEIYNLNNRDVLFRSAILGALINSCDFISIAEDETGYPRMQVIDGTDATGIMDPVTFLLKEGYAVLERDVFGNPVREAYFTPEYTAYYSGGILTEERRNKAPAPLLVPIVYRPDSHRLFGHARISRACMSIVGSALRTIKRSEISAEFFSFPQKWVTGTDQSVQIMDKWAAAMSAMMKFSVNQDGQDHVKVGQFVQQSMTPHLEQLKMFASLFAGETDLTVEDLGFSSGAPAGDEAVKAAHENLRMTAKAAQASFSVGFLNAGYLAACVRDDYKYLRSQLYDTVPVWAPPYAIDITRFGAVGDALQKLGMTFPDYITEEKIFELTGI